MYWVQTAQLVSMIGTNSQIFPVYCFYVTKCTRPLIFENFW